MLVFLPPGTATLTATADSNNWVPLSYQWSVVAGDPAAVTFADPTAASTLVTVTVPGRYVVQCTASAPQQGADLATEADEGLLTPEGGTIIVLTPGTGISPGLSASGQFNLSVVDTSLAYAEAPVIGRDLHVDVGGYPYGVDTPDADHPLGMHSDSLTISETNDENPNTASFAVWGRPPTKGQPVDIRLDGERIFAGLVMRVTTTFDERWENRIDTVSCVDHTWSLKRYRIHASYRDEDPARIVQDIVASAHGFTLGTVQGGLPRTTIDFDTDLASALSALRDQMPGSCTWTCDYDKAVHFGQVNTSRPPPAPLTLAHPTLQNFSAEDALTASANRVRVYGASISLTDGADPNAKTVAGMTAWVGDPSSFGRGGGRVLATGVRAGLTPGSFEDAITPDSYETAFSYVYELVRGDSVLDATTADRNDIAPGAGESPEECLRRLYVQVEGRAIRVEGDGVWVPDGTAGRPPGATKMCEYFVTAVGSAGESTWKQQLQVGVSQTGVYLHMGTGGGEVAQYYNAVELIATAVPPGVQRLNIYRVDETIGAPRLLGSLSARGAFGDLGTHTGTTDAGGVEFNVPIDFGTISTPSSNSLVDSGQELSDEGAYGLPEAPTTPEPEDPCQPTPAPLPPDAPPDTPTAAPTPPPEKAYYLGGLSVFWKLPSGASVQRFWDFDDPAGQQRMATLFGDSGVIEGPSVSGPYKDIFEAEAAAAAALRFEVDTSISWTSRDQHTHPGLLIAVATPGGQGSEYLISAVTISQFEPVGCQNGQKSWPLYTAKAEPRRFSVVDRLLHSYH